MSGTRPVTRMPGRSASARTLGAGFAPTMAKRALGFRAKISGQMASANQVTASMFGQ